MNLTGVLTIRTTKPFGESTVSRILELVENASEKKARTENFITRFARYYTPIVVIVALILAVVPPLLDAGAWSDWILRGLTFLVVSCPCALVISVPLSFFGGIGGASKCGILVKGTNYLETLAKAETVVFDKTGTLTNGTFNVVAVHAEADVDPDLVLSFAAYAETYSDHPIALSVKAAYTGEIDRARIKDVKEESGHGVRAQVDEHIIAVGNEKLMMADNIAWHECELTGTILHVSLDGSYIGHIVIADVVKDDAAEAIASLKAAGVKRTVMLTGRLRREARNRRIPRLASPAEQGRGSRAAHQRHIEQGHARVRGRRHQRRAGAHARRYRHRHGGDGLGCRHRGRRHRAHGRQTLQHRTRHSHRA